MLIDMLFQPSLEKAPRAAFLSLNTKKLCFTMSIHEEKSSESSNQLLIPVYCSVTCSDPCTNLYGREKIIGRIC